MVDVVAFDEHAGAADGIGFWVVILPERFQPSIRIEFLKVLVGNREHAARSTSRAEECLDDAFLSEDVAVRRNKQIDHQPNHFTGWSEVVACHLVGRFVEPPDEFLEDVPHLAVGNHVGVKVDVAELGHDEEQAVVFFERGNLALEARYGRTLRLQWRRLAPTKPEAGKEAT